MKILGALLVASLPAFYGINRVIFLRKQKVAIKAIYEKSRLAVDTAYMTKKEIKEVLKSIEYPFLDFKEGVVTLDENQCKEYGLNSSEILSANNFLNALQHGDTDFLINQSEIYINEIKASLTLVESGYKRSAKTSLSFAFSISLTVFLLLL